MPNVHVDNLTSSDEIIISKRGRMYVVRKGRKYYVTNQKYQGHRRYKPRSGAYNRFIQSQMNGITGNSKVGNTKRRSRDYRNGQGVSTQERQEFRDGFSLAPVPGAAQALESLRDGEHVLRDLHDERHFASASQA
jgi:hypothetical protein